MENNYGDGGSSMTSPKLKSLAGDVSPLNLDPQNFIPRGLWHRHPHLRTRKSTFDPYASSDSCSDSPDEESPLIRYLSSNFGASSGGSSRGRGGGFLSSRPLSEMSPSRSFPLFTSPVKVEEDVIVMDGILVDSSNSPAPKSSGSVRMKSKLTSSDTDGRLQSSLSSILAVGKENNLYKMEKYRSKEEISPSRLGSKCQFKQVKEELRPSRFSSKAKSEVQPCKLYSEGACAYGSNCRFLHSQVNEELPSMETSTTAPAPTRTVSPIELQGSRAEYGNNSFTDTTFANNDWSPLDDGIGVTSPSNEKTPTKEDVDARTKAVLYGPSLKKRLPVFTEFCPE